MVDQDWPVMRQGANIIAMGPVCGNDDVDGDATYPTTEILR